MKKTILLLICFFVGIMIYQKREEIIIPNESIRIRIIANSNSIEDLYVKKKLKDDIKNEIYEMVSTAKTNFSAKEIITNNLGVIEELIASKTSNYHLSFGKNYFPAKSYKGIIYKEGNYDSLIITLGEGLGDNWWCVLYPPLCLIEDNENTSDVEYQLAIKKVLLN